MMTPYLRSLMLAQLNRLPASVVALSLGLYLSPGDEEVDEPYLKPRMEAHVQVGDEVVPWQDLRDGVDDAAWIACQVLEESLRAHIGGMLLPLDELVTVTRADA